MKKVLISAALIAIAGYFGSKFLLHHKVEKGVDAAVLAMSGFAFVEYGGVSSTMTGELTVDDIRIRVDGFDDDIRIERLGIDTQSYFSLLSLADIAENMRSSGDFVADNFGFIVDGVHIDADSEYVQAMNRTRLAELKVTDADTPAAMCAAKYGYSAATLAGLGYTELAFSVSVHFRRRPGGYAVALRSQANDMGDMDAEFLLVGDMAAEFSKGGHYRPRMSSMRIEINDHSFNERVRKYCGRLGLSDEEILQAQLDALQFSGSEFGIEFDEYVIDPYVEYLAGKSTLVITAEPTEPVSLSQISLYKPSDVPALLQLSAEAY